LRYLKTILFFGFAALMFTNTLQGQNEHTRQHLSGNWKGARDSMATKGISFDPRVTLFNQNFITGSGDRESVFNGKVQLGFNFNGQIIKLKSWTLVTKIEYNFGSALDSTGNVLIPKNTSITIPGFSAGNRFDISSLYLVYSWKPGNQILLGKINMIDLAARTKYSGGAGLDAFWNVGFAAPLSGITPPFILGTIANVSGKKVKWTFMAYDPVSAVGTSGLKKPFREGIVLSAQGKWDVNIGNSVGEHGLRVAFSTQDGQNLYNLGNLYPPVDIPLTDKKNRYFASYSFNHSLKQFKNTKESWGLFGQIAFSDGNPNPVDFSFLLGLGGISYMKNGNKANWGAAFYLYSLSSIIDDLAEQAGIPLQNELGLEMFYQYWVTPYFSIGPDVQIIDPIVRKSNTAVFLGLRSSIKL